jgi:hypothetical protein
LPKSMTKLRHTALASPQPMTKATVHASPAVQAFPDRALKGGSGHRPLATAPAITIELSAALITVRDDEPMVLLVDPSRENRPLLPAGPMLPGEHNSLDAGIQSWVLSQTGIQVGYSEQLCSFGEPGPSGRAAPDPNTGGLAVTSDYSVSIGYLALLAALPGDGGAPYDSAADPVNAVVRWVSCYDVLPWEDWRNGRPAVLDALERHLADWADRAGTRIVLHRINLAFGLSASHPALLDATPSPHGLWDEERASERYELLVEAGILDGNLANLDQGLRLGLNHGRMLAVALGRLRAKIKYRPVVFELMDPEFTLFELQRTVEAILGTKLHKQNFRRLIETAGLVEAVGDIRTRTGGRPAKLFRFRPGVVLECPAPGVRIKIPRG